MTRTNQGGSVLGFVTIAVIMAGLLIGGVYIMRQLTTVPRQVIEPPKAVNDKPVVQRKDQGVSTSGNKTNVSKSKSESQSSVSTGSSEQSTSALPQTGPGESLLASTVMLAVLSGVAVSYTRSRRIELSL